MIISIFMCEKIVRRISFLYIFSSFLLTLLTTCSLLLKHYDVISSCTWQPKCRKNLRGKYFKNHFTWKNIHFIQACLNAITNSYTYCPLLHWYENSIFLNAKISLYDYLLFLFTRYYLCIPEDYACESTCFSRGILAIYRGISAVFSPGKMKYYMISSSV